MAISWTSYGGNELIMVNQSSSLRPGGRSYESVSGIDGKCILKICSVSTLFYLEHFGAAVSLKSLKEFGLGHMRKGYVIYLKSILFLN